MARSVGLAWLIVAALLAPRIAVGAECATGSNCSHAAQEPVLSVSADETASSERTATWNAVGRENTRTTECTSGPLSATNKPGSPQANTWEGGNPVLAPALVFDATFNPLRVRICPAVLGVQR
jgi:hypothetical protein